MNGISLHMQWPPTSHPHGSILKRDFSRNVSANYYSRNYVVRGNITYIYLTKIGPESLDVMATYYVQDLKILFLNLYLTPI
jgi:hypothetical protein